MRFPKTLLVFAWLSLGCGPVAWAEPVKPMRALIVGISHYQDASWAQLSSQRDADLMRGVLLERFGADPARVQVLPEKQATRAGIEAALKTLVSQAQPGETVVFYYAGHGAVALAEGEGSPEDGLSECLIPIDTPIYSSPQYPASVVRDQFIEQQLADLVARVRQGGASGSVVFVFDCCHSGGLSRGRVSGVRTNPAVLAYFLEQLKARRRPAAVRQHKAGTRGWVVLSACRADQTAADAPTSFTMVLSRALKDLPLEADYGDLMQRVGNFVLSDPNLHGGQLPQLAGDRTLPVLGGGGRASAGLRGSVSVTRVEEVAGDYLLSLDKGRLMGLNPGTRLDVYPFGTHATGVARLGEAVVDSADSYTASATFTPSVKVTRKDLRDAVAWVTRINLAGDLLKVFADPQILALGGRQSPLHDTTIVKLVGKPEEAQLLARQQGDQLELHWNHQLVFHGPLDHPRLLEGLRQALFAQARRQWLVGRVVAPQDVGLSITARRPAAPSGEALTVCDGDIVDVELKNQRSEPLYLSLLNLSNQGTLEVIYPPQDQWESGKPLLPGASVSVPIEFRLSQPELEAGEIYEGFKVVASSQPVDRLYVSDGTGIGNTLQYWITGKQSRGAAGAATADAKDYALSPIVWIRVKKR